MFSAAFGRKTGIAAAGKPGIGQCSFWPLAGKTGIDQCSFWPLAGKTGIGQCSVRPLICEISGSSPLWVDKKIATFLDDPSGFSRLPLRQLVSTCLRKLGLPCPPRSGAPLGNRIAYPLDDCGLSRQFGRRGTSTATQRKIFAPATPQSPTDQPPDDASSVAAVPCSVPDVVVDAAVVPCIVSPSAVGSCIDGCLVAPGPVISSSSTCNLAPCSLVSRT